MGRGKKEAKAFLKDMMKRCKKERKTKTNNRIIDLAKTLEKTPNYITNIENGHAIASSTLFIEYLMENGFNLSPLKNLKIEETQKNHQKRDKFLQQVYEMDDLTLNFMIEQHKLFNISRTKITIESLSKPSRKKKKKSKN